MAMESENRFGKTPRIVSYITLSEAEERREEFGRPESGMFLVAHPPVERPPDSASPRRPAPRAVGARKPQQLLLRLRGGEPHRSGRLPPKPQLNYDFRRVQDVQHPVGLLAPPGKNV